MGLEIQVDDGHCRVAIAGDLGVYQVANYHQQLVESCAGINALTLDLGAVEEMDSAGVQLLLALRKQLATDALPLGVTAISDQAKQVLEVFNLTDQFKIDAEDS